MTTETLEQLMGWTSPDGNPLIKYYYNLTQHTDPWLAMRMGKITASVMGDLLKKKTDKKTGEVTYEVPDNATTKAYIYELASQRVAPGLADNFQSYAMERGIKDEVDAFNIYSENYEQLRSCGFITNEEHGVLIGFSPDGLTAHNDDGQTESKSRAPKFQTETIFKDQMPDDFTIQVQCGLLVTKRKWCDFISYCGGMPMYVKRIEPDPVIFDAIILGAQQAEKQIEEVVATFKTNAARGKFLPTKKRVEDIAA